MLTAMARAKQFRDSKFSSFSKRDNFVMDTFRRLIGQITEHVLELL